jgi:outer membrane lipoprotein LolB
MCLILLVSVGCVRKENFLKPVDHPAIAWAENQKKLESIKSFEVQGKVGISDGVSAQSIEVSWSQKKNGDYEIDFYGPLDIGLGSVIKNSQGVFLKTPHELLKADDPESLMREEFGWSLPVDGLSDWILGLPTNSQSHQELNAFGYLSKLEDQGWEIFYLGYQSFPLGISQGISQDSNSSCFYLPQEAGLPTRIILKRDPLKLVLVLSDWKVLNRS